MRNTELTTKYKKDMKLMLKSPRFKKCAMKLETYVNMLRAGNKLPPEAKNHQMSKASPPEYSGCFDFHIAPDICVIYRLTDDAVKLIRIGQHNTLGLTENFVIE